MVKTRFKASKRPEQSTWRKTSKSDVKTLPAQSLSVREIVERFAKGIPVDLIKKQGVYVDQSEYDLEKLSRSDFAEKAELADQLRQHHEQVSEAIETDKRTKKAQREKEQSESAKKAAEGGSGIDNLDNTMPDDTRLKPK